jgi:hypothetical protein
MEVSLHSHARVGCMGRRHVPDLGGSGIGRGDFAGMNEARSFEIRRAQPQQRPGRRRQ